MCNFEYSNKMINIKNLSKMKKEYTLTKESIEYWKEDFRYMAGEGSITFREYVPS